MTALPWNHERWLRQPAWAPHFEAMRAWFDLERVARVLAPMSPPSDPLQRVAIVDICYRPPQRLALVYALQGASGRRRHATVHVRGEGPEPAPSPSAHRVGLDTSTAASAWLLPDDPADLPLATVLAPDFTERALGVTVRPGSETLLSYRPGRRLTQSWSLAGADRDAIVLKHHAGAAAAHDRLQRLAADANRRFALPQPLACDAAHAVRWEPAATGMRLAAAAQAEGWPALLARTLDALVDLHGSDCTIATASVPAAPLLSRARVLERLAGKVLRRLQAGLPARADAVASRVEGLLRWQAPATPGDASLHGALRQSSLRVAPDGGIVLLDLDGLARGEAVLDLARLGSEFVLHSLLGQIDPREAWAITTGLPLAYRRALQQRRGAHAEAVLAVPVPAFTEAYAWYLAAMLLAVQLETCVRQAAPAMDGLCVELVRLAGGVLADRGASMLPA